MRETVQLACNWRCLVLSHCDRCRDFETNIRNDNKVVNIKAHLCHTTIPVNTHDTMVRVRGVSRCAKVQHRTRTRGTRFGNTVGKPVPVRNPNRALALSQLIR